MGQIFERTVWDQKMGFWLNTVYAAVFSFATSSLLLSTLVGVFRMNSRPHVSNDRLLVTTRGTRTQCKVLPEPLQ